MSFGEWFYIVKGLLGLVGIGVLIVHMNGSWDDFDRPSSYRPGGQRSGDCEHTGIGQRLRYITLLYFAVLITSVSGDQIAQGIKDVPARSVGALVGVALLAFTAYVSVKEAKRLR